MFEYNIICSLIILVLIKLNFSAIKRLKEHKHDAYNIKKLMLAKEELYDKNFDQQRNIMLLEYRIEQCGKEIQRQQEINYSLVIKYNRIRESIIDVPLKHGRFFDVHVPASDFICNFSEN